MSGSFAAEQKEYWESIADRRRPDHPAVVAFVEPKLSLIRQLIPQAGLTMLEVGAGNGFFSVTFAKHFDLTCTDFSQNMLGTNPLPTERKIRAHAERLPFEDATFDVVFCGNLLHHLEEPLVAVREMARVARRYVVLLEPNALNPLMFLFGLLKKPERGTLRSSRGYLEGLGQQAGLRLRATKVQGAVLPNRSPTWSLPLLRKLDSAHPFGFYVVSVFEVPHQP